VGDEQRVQGRAPDPRLRLQQQLPAIQPEPEHRGKTFGGTATVRAKQTIYHDADHQSAIVLPVIPARR